MSDWYRAGNPQRQAVARYRDPETIQNDETLDAFLDFLKYDTDASPEFVEQVKAHIEGFLEYKMDDVKAGEAEMLRLWTEEKPIKV